MLDARAPDCRDCPLGKDNACILRAGYGAGRLDRARRLARYAPGESVARQGAPFRYVGVVTRGALRTVSHDAGGHGRVLGLHLTGDIFGQPFVGEAPYGIEASAQTAACIVERSLFEESLASHPELMRAYSMALLRQIRAAQETLEMLAPYRVSERIARFMIGRCMTMGSEHRDSAPALHGDGTAEIRSTLVISLPAPRRDVAALLGTTLETISRFLQDMVRRKILRIRDARHFTVLDFAGLRRIAGVAPDPGSEPDIQLAGTMLIRPEIRLPLEPAGERASARFAAPAAAGPEPIALTAVNSASAPYVLVRRQ